MEEVKVEQGIKETKELIAGIFAVAALLTERLKDGAQFEDAIAFYTAMATDEAFKAKVIAAYDNAKAIPEEMKDLSMEEGFELAMFILPEVLKIIKSIKK